MPDTWHAPVSTLDSSRSRPGPIVAASTLIAFPHLPGTVSNLCLGCLFQLLFTLLRILLVCGASPCPGLSPPKALTKKSLPYRLDTASQDLSLLPAFLSSSHAVQHAGPLNTHASLRLLFLARITAALLWAWLDLLIL